MNLTVFGSIALTVMLCMEGQAESNKWGENSKIMT